MTGVPDADYALISMVLVGDVGGTKTDLAIYTGGSTPHTPLVRKQFHSADYVNLQSIVTEFLADVNEPVRYAAFGVPGPVVDKTVVTTNLPWVASEDSLAADLNLTSVRLMNDLEAVACAIPILHESDLVTLNAGVPVPRATIGVIAPGTGLGQSFLAWDGSYYVPHSSEGGHADFAAAGKEQVRLLEHLLTRFDHVSVERVCSGIGLPNIYEYFRDVERIGELPDVAQQIASTTDRTRVIIDAAIHSDTPSSLCRATVDMFVSILAGECGNLALRVLATGGIYLAGGIVTHTLSLLQEPAFMRAFMNKGRLSEFMKRIPVHAIITNAALLGAAHYALEHFVEEGH